MKHIVINSKGNICIPASDNYPTKEAVHSTVSFETQAEAQKYATHLAGIYPNHGFTVFSAVGTAKTEPPPVRWTKVKSTKPA